MNLEALVAASIGGLLLASIAEPRLLAGWSRQASLEGDRACRAGIDVGLREGGRRLPTIDCNRNHDGDVAVTRTIAADDYRGKRMRQRDDAGAQFVGDRGHARRLSIAGPV